MLQRTFNNISIAHHKTGSKHGCPRRISSSLFLQKVEVLSVIEERKKYLLKREKIHFRNIYIHKMYDCQGVRDDDRGIFLGMTRRLV